MSRIDAIRKDYENFQTQKKIIYYISEFVVEEKIDWRAYERHKRKLSEICKGNSELYEFAIENLIDKLGEK